MALNDDLIRTLPALQPQRFNALQPGAMQPTPAAPPDPNAPMAYGDQMRNIGGAIARGLGAAGNFIFNAPGGGGVLDPNRFTAAAATTPAPTPPQPVNAKNTAAANAAPPVPTPAPGAATPTAKLPTLKRAATAAPAAAAEPALVPGETGFYVGNQLVPYGAMQSFQGGQYAAPSAGAGGAGGVGALIDPRQYFQDNVNAQMRYAQAAAQQILDQAGNGNQLGYSARLHALSQVYLNGLAGVGQGGANTFNQSAASITDANTAAAASRYGADQGLLGAKAHAGATYGAAKLGYDEAKMRDATENRKLDTDSIAIGTDLQHDPSMPGMPAVPVTRYGQRPKAAGAMPAPYDAAPAKAKPKEGDTGKYQGKAVVYRNGDWTYQ